MVSPTAYIFIALIVYGAACCVIFGLGVVAWVEASGGYAKGNTDGLQRAGLLVLGIVAIALTLVLAWGWIRPDPGISDAFISSKTATAIPNDRH